MRRTWPRESARFPGRRLSLVRLAVVLGTVAALTFGGVSGVRSFQDTRAAEASLPWFAAYVDVTASPMHAFETPAEPAERNIVLSFLVAADATTCEATWGGYHTLEDAKSELELDRRLARLGQFDGQVVLSFGGEAGTDLAQACDTAGLVEQYQAAISRYAPVAIDLDIEGAALEDPGSRARRVQALAQVQQGAQQPVPVWLTLPAGEHGLTPAGVEVVREFLEAGVAIAGVNAMTMNFTGENAAADLAGVITTSLRATHRQLSAIFADAGEVVGERTIWRRLGATPMIGQNDVGTEVFTLGDARALHEFAVSVGLGRLSMWSANRDRPCAQAYVDQSVVSESCSGFDQGEESYAAILGAGFTGAPDGGEFTEDPASPLHPESLRDDPATSPYPIWSPEADYPAEARVVWRRHVYEAKWWNTSVQPDDPTITGPASPWHLLGPVLEGEEPIPLLTLPAGHYPTWDADAVYTRGDRVMADGRAYEAKWWTERENPAAGQMDPGSSPWRELTQEEIAELLGE